MSPAEQALADQSPTFADLCERVRTARTKHNRALDALKAADDAAVRAKEAVTAACSEEDAARDALDDFIDRETVVQS